MSWYTEFFGVLLSGIGFIAAFVLTAVYGPGWYMLFIAVSFLALYCWSYAILCPHCHSCWRQVRGLEYCEHCGVKLIKK